MIKEALLVGWDMIGWLSYVTGILSAPLVLIKPPCSLRSLLGLINEEKTCPDDQDSQLHGLSRSLDFLSDQLSIVGIMMEVDYKYFDTLTHVESMRA